MLYVFWTLIAFALGAFGICVVARGWIAGSIAVVGVSAFGFAVAAIVYAILKDPGLLRSGEEHLRLGSTPTSPMTILFLPESAPS